MNYKRKERYSVVNLISDRLLTFLINYKAVVREDSEEIEVYRYGLEITVSSILNIVIILALGFLLGNVPASILFLMCIIPLRQFTGGYHASSYFKCNLIFALVFLWVYIMSQTLSRYIPYFLSEVLLMLGFCVVYAFSPVKNKHKAVTENNKVKYKKIASVIYAVLGVVALVTMFFNDLYGSVIMFTLLSVVVLILIEITAQRRVRQ